MPRKAMSKTTIKTEETVVKTEEKNEEVKQTVSKPKKREFDPNDGIPCRSVTYGKLFISGTKTGMVYTFSDYDDESELAKTELDEINGIISNFDKETVEELENTDLNECKN